MIPFLPQSWKWKMVAWKMTLVSKGAIFHFHDYGSNDKLMLICSLLNNKTPSPPLPETVATSWCQVTLGDLGLHCTAWNQAQEMEHNKNTFFVCLFVCFLLKDLSTSCWCISGKAVIFKHELRCGSVKIGRWVQVHCFQTLFHHTWMINDYSFPIQLFNDCRLCFRLHV